jgi:hypothetical protein
VNLMRGLDKMRNDILTQSIANAITLRGRGLLSILDSAIGYKSKQEYQEGHSAKDAANRMEPAPSLQETARFF